MTESPRRPALSKRQDRILRFIVSYMEENGWAPSVREIATAVDLNSTSAVVHQLAILEARGYIRRRERSPRSISVIP